MKSPRLSLWLAASLSLVLACPLTAQDDGLRTIEFETIEVTDGGVAVSPDGKWLILTILGHLFRLPAGGGDAEQLTFGPYYHMDPAVSPDGSQVAFVSDRDGSEGNIFILELESGELTQLTHDSWAGRPVWSPDGGHVAYLEWIAESPSVGPWGARAAVVRRVFLRNGAADSVSAEARPIRSVFYLPDRRLAWTFIEQPAVGSGGTTRIETLNPDGSVSTLGAVGGIVDRVEPSPGGDGVYCRRFYPAARTYYPHREELVFIPIPAISAEPERTILPLSNPRGPRPRFDVAGDGQNLYLTEAGRLWRIELPSRTRRPVPFRARVRMEVQPPVRPARWAPEPLGGSLPARAIAHPRLSPDGRSLLFGAAGFLWEQSLDGAEGRARRLLAGKGWERDPAFSPDGRLLAFVWGGRAGEEVRVVDSETGQIQTIASGTSFWNLGWSRPGDRLVFTEQTEDSPESQRAWAVDVRDGSRTVLAGVGWWDWWSPRTDGRWLYVIEPEDLTTIYRVPLGGDGDRRVVVRLDDPAYEALASPEGRWLAVRRDPEIWVAPLGLDLLKEGDFRRVAAEGAETFAFTPDGSEIIYSTGNRIWRQPLDGRPRAEIPVGLDLPRARPPPLLLERVRLLDFDSGGFGPETSLLIEDGRIRGIGPEAGRPLPPGTATLDAGGRFAIPGLFEFHAHNLADYRDAAAFIAYGITSVRDVGHSLLTLGVLADRSGTRGDP